MDEIGQDFQLPTCPRLFNIFHPFDPVVSSTDYSSSLLVEQFSIECQKSKTKVITATNQSKDEIVESQWELGVKLDRVPWSAEKCKRLNRCWFWICFQLFERLALVFRLFGERSLAKPNPSRITQERENCCVNRIPLDSLEGTGNYWPSLLALRYQYSSHKQREPARGLHIVRHWQ